jgi:cation:H+ antiporter
MTLPSLWIWFEFVLCVGIIGVAGSRLSFYGDVIADKTGLGGTWIGLVLMATVTSLPELITGVSAVTLTHAPNIAVGDILGSCVFNLTLITVLDFLQREGSVFTRASQGHILSAGFGVILLGIIGFHVMLATRTPLPAVVHVGLYGPVLVVVYLVAMRTLFRYGRRQIVEFVEEHVERHPHITLREASIRYGLMAVVVVGAAAWLPFIGEDLAKAMGWHRTFVGTLFVAFATSVPEIVVTIAALRLGALDMAISNLFGSNLFNCLILVVDDLLFMPGPILSHVSPLHAVSAISAITMSGIAMVGLIYRPSTRIYRTVGWASLFLIPIYLLNAYVLYVYHE